MSTLHSPGDAPPWGFGDWRDTFLSRLSAGSTVTAALHGLPIARTQAYLLRTESSKFAGAWAAAMEHRTEARVETMDSALYQRGAHGLPRDVWYQGKVCGEEQIYDTAAAKAWAQANDPRYQRQESQGIGPIQVTIDLGGQGLLQPVDYQGVVDVTPLPVDDTAQLPEALPLSAPSPPSVFDPENAPVNDEEVPPVS